MQLFSMRTSHNKIVNHTHEYFAFAFFMKIRWDWLVIIFICIESEPHAKMRGFCSSVDAFWCEFLTIFSFILMFC